MIHEFKEFLAKTNALALAVAFIIGAAAGDVVKSVVTDLLMPVIGIVLPKGGWEQASLQVGPEGNAVKYGHFFGAAVNFVIISFVVFLIMKALIKPGPAPLTCPFCKTDNDPAASKCKACASALSAA